MRHLTIQVLLITAGVFGVCRPSTAQTTGTADDLVKRAVAALQANDQQALAALSIDQGEFKKYVWSNMAQPTNTSADKYYVTHRKVSEVGINEATTALAGKKWTVVKVNLDAPKKKGKGYQLFGSPQITLRDDAGQENTLRLIGGLLERDGAYKVTSFYVSPSLKASK